MIDLLLVRGGPGVGKSTVTELLSKHMADGVVIETDTIRAMVNNVSWTNVDEHISAVIATGRLAICFLERGYRPVVIVDTFSGGTLKFVVDQIGMYRYRVASLIAESAELKRRIVEREEGFRAVDVSIWVNDNILNNNEPYDTLIDTTNLTAQMVVTRLLAICNEL